MTSVLELGSTQMALVDTPPLEDWMDAGLLERMDTLCMVIGATELSAALGHPATRRLLAGPGAAATAAVLTFVDHYPARLLTALVNRVTTETDLPEVVPVCAPSGVGFDRLLPLLEGAMPERGRLFPDGCTSLHSERFLVSEQIRASLLRVLPADISTTTAVQIEEFSIRDGKRYVRANLHVARGSSKGVVIGRRGSTLQSIAEDASAGSSEILRRQLHLDLWVKVREGWPERQEDLLEFGYVC